jgi:hypothetical protein
MPASSRLARCLRPGLALGMGLVLALGALRAAAQAPQPPAELEQTLKTMLSAMQSRSLPDFVAAGDSTFKSTMTKEMLAGVSASLGPRLAQGYTDTFLGTVNQQGYTVYLWKIQFKDGKDDRVVTMAVKDGKVGGFFLR